MQFTISAVKNIELVEVFPSSKILKKGKTQKSQATLGR